MNQWEGPGHTSMYAQRMPVVQYVETYQSVHVLTTFDLIGARSCTRQGMYVPVSDPGQGTHTFELLMLWKARLDGHT